MGVEVIVVLEEVSEEEFGWVVGEFELHFYKILVRVEDEFLQTRL